MSPSVMMNLKSMRPMYETLIKMERTMTPAIKIKSKTTIIIIQAAVPATQELDTVSTTTTVEATPTIPKSAKVSHPRNSTHPKEGTINQARLKVTVKNNQPCES